MKDKSIAFLFIIIIFLIVLSPFIKIFYDYYQEDRLKKTGIPAKAVILSIKDTGNTYNYQPQVKIVLEVKPEGKESYKTEIKMYISPVYLAQFQPGAVVNVKYNPKNPNKVVVVSGQTE